MKAAVRSAAALWLAWGSAAAGPLPAHTPIPGGIATVVLGPADTPRPTAQFGEPPILVVKDADRWVGIVGIGLDIVPGRYIVKTTDEDHSAHAHEFTVRAHRYRVTPPRPTVKSRGSRPPPPALSDVTYERAVQALTRRRAGRAPGLPLRTPAQDSGLEDRFGEREVDAQTSSLPIRFVAFEVSTDTVVHAPAAGRIVEVLERAAGHVVIVDHGMGLVSVLWPISPVAVRAGQDVDSGATLGVPASQADTEAVELRWSVALNAEFVNPRLLLAKPGPEPRHAVSR